MESSRTQELSTRGKAAAQSTMLMAVKPGALVPQGHPIRRIKPMVDKPPCRAVADVQSNVLRTRTSVNTS